MNSMNTPDKQLVSVFNHFQTDIWKNKKSRVFVGTFSSFENANQAAKDLELYRDESDVVILKVVVNKV